MPLFILKPEYDKTKKIFSRSFSLSGFIFITIIIFILDIIYPVAGNHFRKFTTIALSPVMSFISSPIIYANNTINDINNLNNVYEINKELQIKLQKLQNYEEKINDLKRENKKFRALLNYDNYLEKYFITARVITDTGGMFERTLLLNRGESYGVSDNLGVVGSKGLLGRTINTTINNSRVLLLTDINSALPVLIQGADENAIMIGDSSMYPVLQFIDKIKKVKVGQKVITSGHGGLFPAGVVIGEIKSINEINARIKLYSYAGSENYVRIVKFKYVDKQE